MKIVIFGALATITFIYKHYYLSLRPTHEADIVRFVTLMHLPIVPHICVSESGQH